MIVRVIQTLVLSILLLGSLAPARAGTMVTNLNDSGEGSLREAIGNAAPGGVIEFQDGLSGTITLQSALPALDKNLDILGPGADVITVSGANQHQVFSIDAGVTVTISGLTIADGVALFFGGGIGNRGTLTLIASVVTGNATDKFGLGGGIDNFEGTVTISHSTVSGNTAGTGGGINNDGTLVLRDSIVSGNSTDEFGTGGGIANFGDSSIIRSTVSGNSADFGGGFDNGGDLTVLNSTISGNSALSEGGGIDNFGGSVTLVHATVSHNSAVLDGGGILNDGVLTVKNSLIVNSPSGGDCANVGTFAFTGMGDNRDTDTSCPGFVTATPTELKLGALADNGGPTMTHALLQGSVAIEAAAECTQTDGTTPVTEDQRGIERPQGTDCDIGAYERAESTGLPEVRLTPGRLDFGDQPLDEPTEPLMGLVENIGGSDLNIGALSVVGIHAGDFSVSGDSCSNQTVVAGGACGFEVVFTAKAAGVRSARVRIPSDAADGPHFVDLVGTHDVIFFDGFEGD